MSQKNPNAGVLRGDAPGQYRPEIDGLRAIAVLAVIICHSGTTWVPGGFVGVDVFFVISGYLITRILLGELEAGVFTLAGFYERRARRILPALFCVLLCCLPFAWFLLLPDQLEKFSRSILWALVFISNFWFRGETGYFAADANEMPLLHTWSLGVEEQFYLFFPLLVFLCWRGKQRKWILTAVVLLVAFWSLKYADRKSWHGSAGVFFVTQARVWELFLGALAAIYLTRWRASAPRRWLAETGSALGLLMILFACARFGTGTPFPGRYTLLPALGALGVILFATPQTLCGRLLSLKPVVGVGLVSYSAYLWHQPVFVFARLSDFFLGLSYWPERIVKILLCLLPLALAYLSWRFVEQPFRRKQFLRRDHIFHLSIGWGVLLGAIALGGVWSQGWPGRFSPEESDLLMSHGARTRYVGGRFNEIQKNQEAFGAADRPRVLILGDSYAQDLVNMLHENKLLPGAQIRARFMPPICQIYRGGEDALAFVEGKYKKLCAETIPRFHEGLRDFVDQADMVVLAASWTEWSAERLPATLRNLEIPPQTRVIVLGRKNFGEVRRRRYLELSREEKIALRNASSPAHLRINARMKQNLDAAGIEFIDLHAIVCGEASGTCPVFTPEGKLISHDGGHLTQAGAAYLGRLLKEHSALGTM
ncbi:MAG: acyltransferase [Zoogloeaceae bacterium]|jgi:peptidoglycan/LPS O-acetylase OafA/YrhL|nr:acyltransferase [Zoogloeaceae bacterium]